MLKYRYHLIQPVNPFKTLKEKSPILDYNISVEPYAGCQFLCPYCRNVREEDIKPDSYKIGVKTNLAYSLNKKIDTFSEDTKVIFGAISDPYQPVENDFKITRICIEICLANKCSITIWTKSIGILRDIDLLSDYSKKSDVSVIITIFTIKENIKKIFEPLNDSIKKRFNLIEKLKLKNIKCGIALMPVIPYINDSKKELEELFRIGYDSGTDFILSGIFMIDSNAVKKRFENILEKYFKFIKEKVNLLYNNINIKNEYQNKISSLILELSEKYNIPQLENSINNKSERFFSEILV